MGTVGCVIGLAYNAWRMMSMAWQCYMETLDPMMLNLYREQLAELTVYVTALSD